MPADRLSAVFQIRDSAVVPLLPLTPLSPRLCSPLGIILCKQSSGPNRSLLASTRQVSPLRTIKSNVDAFVQKRRQRIEQCSIQAGNSKNRARDELDMTVKNTLLEIRERAKLVAVLYLD